LIYPYIPLRFDIWLNDEEKEKFGYEGNVLSISFAQSTAEAVAFYNLHCEDDREDLVEFFIRGKYKNAVD